MSLPDGGGSSYSYPSPNEVDISETVATSPQLLTRNSRFVLDGFGRKTQSVVAGVTVDSSYDELGRIKSASNPYFTTSDPTYGTTIFTYDPMGRHLTVQNPDLSTKVNQYSGKFAQVNDEATRQRILETDALGRLKSVCEVTTQADAAGNSPSACSGNFGGSGFTTQYSYDSAGNLLSVSQGSLLPRTFAYDSLSRLTQASNPESGTISYFYTNSDGTLCSGNGSNLCRKSDARGITTYYSYNDPLNRLTDKTYSDTTTAQAHFQYDVSNESNAVLTKGRLTYESTTSGSSTVTKRSISQYDPMGRIVVEGQCVKDTCQTGYFPLNYSYNALGQIAQISNGFVSPNPNAITIQYGYDSAAHLTKVTSSVTEDSLHPATLLSADSASDYSAMGLVSARLAVFQTAQANLSFARSYDKRSRLYAEQTLSAYESSHGTGTVTISGTEQSLSGTTSSGTLQVTGTEQSKQVLNQAATQSTGSFTINGTAPSSGSTTMTLRVNGSVVASTAYGVGSTTTGVATILKNAINNNSSSPVTATLSGSTINLTSKGTGSTTNYSLSGTPSSISPPTQTMYVSTSGAMTGGRDAIYNTVYDSGTVTVTINGHSAPATWGQSSTAQSLATAIAAAINTNDGAFLRATANAATVSLTSLQSGTSTNWPITVTVAYDTADFSSSSFAVAATGMSGATDTGVYDFGTVSITVNGVVKTVSYGQGDSPASIAGKLAAAMGSCATSPATGAAAGSVVTLTSCQSGSGGYYAYSASTTFDSAHFSSSSFATSTSGPSLASNSGGALYSYQLTFEPNGNVQSLTDSLTGQWTYTYDPLNRLSAMNSSSGPYLTISVTYPYDRYGNRWTPAATGNSPIGIYQTAATFTGNDNKVDQWRTAGKYDLSGNLLNDNNHNYSFDAENRLSTADMISYLYDANGRRVAKLSGGAVTNIYILSSAGDQITELSSSQAWLHTNVFAAGRLIATYDSAGTHFQLPDHLGTRRVQAGADGSTELECLSLPFGDNLQCSGPAADSSEHHFTGKERDIETGLDYFGARYYGSNIGRWMSPDWAAKPVAVPYADLADPQSLNLYAYVRNNPITKNDPDGHKLNCSGDQCARYIAESQKATGLALSVGGHGAVKITGTPREMSAVAKQFAKIVGDPNHTVKVSADSHNQVIGGNYDFSGNGSQRLNYNSIDQLSSAKGGFSPASVTIHETTEAYQGLLNGNNFGQAHQTAIQYENLVRIQEGLGPRIGESSTLTNGGTGARIEVNFSFYKEIVNVNLQVPSVTSTQSVPSMQPVPVN